MNSNEQISNFLIALQVIDAVTTAIALNNPKLKEGNKFLAWLMSKIGVIPALVVMKAQAIALIAWGHSYVHNWILLALVLFYVWVIWNNLRLIDDHK